MSGIEDEALATGDPAESVTEEMVDAAYTMHFVKSLTRFQVRRILEVGLVTRPKGNRGHPGGNGDAAVAEREACAALMEEHAAVFTTEVMSPRHDVYRSAAAAIRARGITEELF